METTNSFYDLCVPFNKDKHVMKKILAELREMSYRTIAIEHVYDHTKKDNSKRMSDLFPPPPDIDFLNEFKNKIKILHRLTIIYSDIGISHGMANSANIRKYDLIAGLPQTEAALNHCCSTFNGDIICFDPDDGKLLIQRKSYQVAVKRGIYFEIKYAEAIRNSTHRKNMIKIMHNYHAKGKSKNIIFSSGAMNEFELRGPFDVANLSLLFGLSEEQGKGSITSQCRSLLVRAESRRIGKTIMFVTSLGPVVFSSDEETDEESDTDFSKIEVESDEDDGESQPKKKKKIE